MSYLIFQCQEAQRYSKIFEHRKFIFIELIYSSQYMRLLIVTVILQMKKLLIEVIITLIVGVTDI